MNFKTLANHAFVFVYMRELTIIFYLERVET